MRIINIQMLKNYFHYVIENNIIDEVDENFFNSNNDIKMIYETIKEHKEQTDKIELNPANLISINPKINSKLLSTLLNDTSYKQLDRDFIEKEFKNEYDKYNVDNYSHQLIDAIRNGNYELAKNLNINEVNFNNKIYGYQFNIKQEYDKLDYIFYPLFKERQVGCIFGKTGQGKSIFTLDVANMIASGKTYWDNFRVDTPPQKVLYIDFELGGEILKDRYKNKDFSENLFIHCVDNFEFNKYIGFDSKSSVRIIKSLDYIEKLTKQYDVETIFIDNLSNIADQVEQAGDAERFVNELYGRTKHKKLTIILISHTPKIPNNVTIEINHLKGSSTLTKTFGSVVAFNKTKDKNISYIKQVKYRSEDCIFDSENVGMFEFIKEKDFQLNYIGTGIEDDLLEKKKGRPQQYDNIIKYEVVYDMMEGMSYRKVAEKYNISRGTIVNIKKEYDQNPNFKDEYDYWIKNKTEGNELF